MARWTFYITNRQGVKLREITTLATERKGSWRLNRPASLTMRVPADNPRIAALHDDGLPLIASRARGLKAYRDGVLRFAGYIYSVQDIGNEEGAWSTFTAMDPMQELAYRLARDGSGNYPNAEDTRLVAFADTDGGVIARTIIERTNAVAPTGVTTAGGAVSTLNARTVAWERKFLYPALLELAESDQGFDILFDPVDRVDGYFAIFTAVPYAGTFKPNAKLSWGASGRANVREIKRLEDGTAYRSAVHGFGSVTTGTEEGAVAAQLISVQFDAASIATWGIVESVNTYGDVVDQTFLDSLVTADLLASHTPRTVVEVSPLQGRAPQPWDDFGLGDSFNTYGSVAIRGGFQQALRCTGWDISMDDIEIVDTILTTPYLASAGGSGGGG